jgi:phage FluMu protein gp41
VSRRACADRSPGEWIVSGTQNLHRRLDLLTTQDPIDADLAAVRIDRSAACGVVLTTSM